MRHLKDGIRILSRVIEDRNADNPVRAGIVEDLKASRGICFEDVVFHIERGDILDDYSHPNQQEYPEQRIMVIAFNNYAYLVPYVENEEEVFLKTIISSRKATRRYLGEKYED